MNDRRTCTAEAVSNADLGSAGGGTILVVDDLRENRELFSSLLSSHGYVVTTASNGVEALASVRRQLPDLVLSDCVMPDMNGYELCRTLKNRPITRFTPVVLVTGSDDEDARLEGIQAGADDFLRKPVRTQELMARVSSLIRLKRAIDELDSVETLVLSLARTVEARDSYTAGHCERMAYLAGEFGAHFGLPTDAVAALRRGGYLHDVGKISLPDAILRKVGPLTDDEFTQMKSHTIVGDALCADLRLLHSVRPIVRQHHERLDGSGYPDGAKGDDISLLAQIIGIVDVFDALTTERPYRRAMCPKDAYEHLRCEAAKGWRRAELVEEFVALGVTGGFGSQFALP